MDKLINEIFDKLNKDIPNLADTESAISEEVEEILDILKDILPAEQFEKVSDVVFQAANVAERQGFRLGVKFMAKLLVESLT